MSNVASTEQIERQILLLFRGHKVLLDVHLAALYGVGYQAHGVARILLHPLRGDLKGFWAVSVSGNWRIIFRFGKGNAYDVDLVDYH